MLRIYSPIKADWHASYYYRIISPCAAFEELGLAQCLIDRGLLEISNEERNSAALFSDLNWLYQPMFDISEVQTTTKKVGAFKRTDGEIGYPTSFVIDTDDDLFYVHPQNTHFGKLGYRLPDGRELEEDDVINIQGPDGPVPMWVGGENIDYTKNKKLVDQYRKNLASADLVTCSTEASRRYVLREVPDANTFVHPNCIDLDDFPKTELAKHPDEIRILWAGSNSHYPDLVRVIPSIARILKKHKNVTFYFWGVPNYKFLENIDPDRVTLLPHVPYYEYKLRLAMINHDISIAPLLDCTFNASRSALKWYENSSLHIPVPVLAENTGPYSDEIEHGTTGLLFNTMEEFEDRLSALIEDAVLRKELATNAKDWVRTHRDPIVWAQHLFDAFNNLRQVRANITPPYEEKDV